MSPLGAGHARGAALAPVVAVGLVLAVAVLTACSSSGASSRSSPGASSRASSDVRGRPSSGASGASGSRTVAAPGTVSGHVEQVDIPSSDGFVPRPAYVYVPEADGHEIGRVPVLELLHGTPGRPSSWITSGGLVATVDAFAARHAGAAPLVVMPDENGTEHGDSECIRTATGKDTESYLTGDVVRWVRQHYGRLVGHGRWWIAGLSEGGLCSLMLALRHPGLYSTFGDFSGLNSPIVDHLDRAQSYRQLYGGDTATRLAHEPLWLLAHHRYPNLRGWFECGDQDTVVLSQTRAAAAAASAAGVHERLTVNSGGHTWPVWQQSLRSFLPWAWGNRR